MTPNLKVHEPIEHENRKTFESGAQRSTDADHARYDLVPRAAIEFMARTLKEGAERYGEQSWRKGIPSSDLWNHLLQHAYKWIDGDRSEDHLGHLMCNAAFLCHFHQDEINKIYENNAAQ